MKKKKIWIVLAVIVGLLVIGNIVNNSKEGDNSDTSKNNGDEVQMISESEKDKLKKEVSKKLEDKNVTNIDILTDSQTSEPIISLQLQGDIEKANINKDELESLGDEIVERVKGISDKYSIEFIDKNFQLIMVKDNEGIRYFD